MILVTAVTAATLAAVVPARTASRLPVMAALAGRRPLGRVPRHLVPIGVGLFTPVSSSLAAASSGRRGYASATAIVGGLLVLAGMCCCSPLAVDAMSRAAARAGRSWRFAGRSLGRTRTRSAAVVTAIAVTGALAIVGSAAAMSSATTARRPTCGRATPRADALERADVHVGDGRGRSGDRRLRPGRRTTA